MVKNMEIDKEWLLGKIIGKLRSQRCEFQKDPRMSFDIAWKLGEMFRTDFANYNRLQENDADPIKNNPRFGDELDTMFVACYFFAIMHDESNNLFNFEIQKAGDEKIFSSMH